MTAADENRALIERFYDAFSKRDADGMAACYHREIEFSDPVFPDLRGTRASQMWRMLCTQASADFALRLEDVQAGERTASARWSADYTFGATGRKVHNQIAAQFEIEDGLIRRHRDSFSFWRWASMALGPAGLLLGWTPLIKAKVRGQARSRLDRFSVS